MRHHQVRVQFQGKRAQSTAEYAVLVAVLVAAVVGMQIYVKRGIAGRLRQAADSVGEQYAPKHTTTAAGGFVLTVTSDTKTESKLLKDQVIKDAQGNDKTVDLVETTTTITKDETKRSGSETVGPLGTSL